MWIADLNWLVFWAFLDFLVGELPVFGVLDYVFLVV